MLRFSAVVLLLLGLAVCLVSAQNTTAPSTSFVPPPAPINVENHCKNHIVNICPAWSLPAGVNYTSYIVYFSQDGCATCTNHSIGTKSTSGRVTNLLPDTSYTFTVVGVLPDGRVSQMSTPVTFKTDPADPKLDSSLDISNIQCVSMLSTTTNREVIKCTWNPASEPLTRLVIKWRCTSVIRKNDSNKKRLYGSRAQATSVILNVNRDVATCAVYFRAYYTRRPTHRVALTVIMSPYQ